MGDKEELIAVGRVAQQVLADLSTQDLPGDVRAMRLALALRPILAKAKADAWDEGVEYILSGGSIEPTNNPYRKDDK